MPGTVHDAIAAWAGPCLDLVVLDLGAGNGRTAAALANSTDARCLVALDHNAEAVASAGAFATPVIADLVAALPFADGTVDVVVSHNVLECLVDPGKMLREAHRVVKPGGRVLLCHTDFDTIVLVTADRDLNRRVCQTYADLPVLYSGMAHADAQMGRRLLGLVRRSPLAFVEVSVHVTVETELAGAALARVSEMAASVGRSARHGLGSVSEHDVQRWLQDLQAAQDGGDFLFSETAYLVSATRSTTEECPAPAATEDSGLGGRRDVRTDATWEGLDQHPL
jgi:SAM-dependent methyltransferase